MSLPLKSRDATSDGAVQGSSEGVSETLDEFIDRFGLNELSQRPRALVLRAEGPVFSAGHDLKVCGGTIGGKRRRGERRRRRREEEEKDEDMEKERGD